MQIYLYPSWLCVSHCKTVTANGQRPVLMKWLEHACQKRIIQKRLCVYECTSKRKKSSEYNFKNIMQVYITC